MLHTQSRRWVATINNPTETDNPKTWNVAFIAGQKEKVAQGTERYQLYVELSKEQRLSYMKFISAKAHWEIARGTQRQCIDYVTKKETHNEEPFECGTKMQHTNNQRKISPISSTSSSMERTSGDYDDVFLTPTRITTAGPTSVGNNSCDETGCSKPSTPKSGIMSVRMLTMKTGDGTKAPTPSRGSVTTSLSLGSGGDGGGSHSTTQAPQTCSNSSSSIDRFMERTQNDGCANDTLSAKYVDRARQNYGRFRKLDIKAVTESMVKKSSAGLEGWYDYGSGEGAMDHEIPGLLSSDKVELEEAIDETPTNMNLSTCGPAEQNHGTSSFTVQKDLTRKCTPEEIAAKREGALNLLKLNASISRKCTPEEIATKKAKAVKLLIQQRSQVR